VKLFTTDDGIAREADDGGLELLELAEADLGALLERDPELARTREAAVRRRVKPDDVRILAPVRRPGKIVCMGINYQSHVDEVRPLLEGMGAQVPTDPVFFLVPGSAVNNPGDPIVLPEIAPERVDYEVELAAVIGRGGSHIPEAEAISRVAGYTLANDVSARDVQALAMSGQEFTLTHAKGIDGFKPLGPALVTTDEFDDPIDVHVETRVNGELRQDARTSDFVHPLARCIAHVTRYMRLDPGDVILTGSPAGVGFFKGVFLKPGDIVELTADRIGTLRNPVIASSTDR
jgi:2-keto-4-pentenoate hydratase/2-oxohepta-3-ene-1,7-dioic acid hydratase in catechol pathway